VPPISEFPMNDQSGKLSRLQGEKAKVGREALVLARLRRIDDEHIQARTNRIQLAAKRLELIRIRRLARSTDERIDTAKRSSERNRSAAPTLNPRGTVTKRSRPLTKADKVTGDKRATHNTLRENSSETKAIRATIAEMRTRKLEKLAQSYERQHGRSQRDVGRESGRNDSGRGELGGRER